MRKILWVGTTLVLMLAVACTPVDPDGASQADYQHHKANRAAYLYQGI